MKTPLDIFTGVVVAALLILTAWGNAVAMFAFSAIAMLALVALPGLRAQIPPKAGWVVGLVGVAAAVGAASLVILTRSH